MKRVVYMLVPLVVILIILWDPASRIRCVVTEFGVFELLTLEATTMESGDQTVPAFQGRTKFLRQTTTLTEEAGTLFGYNYRVTGLTPGENTSIQMVYLHPSLPNGRLAIDWPLKAGADGTASSSIRYFRGDMEGSIAGEWTLEIWLGTRRLAKKSFQLTPPR